MTNPPLWLCTGVRMRTVSCPSSTLCATGTMPVCANSHSPRCRPATDSTLPVPIFGKASSMSSRLNIPASTPIQPSDCTVSLSSVTMRAFCPAAADSGTPPGARRSSAKVPAAARPSFLLRKSMVTSCPFGRMILWPKLRSRSAEVVFRRSSGLTRFLERAPAVLSEAQVAGGIIDWT